MLQNEWDIQMELVDTRVVMTVEVSWISIDDIKVGRNDHQTLQMWTFDICDLVSDGKTCLTACKKKRRDDRVGMSCWLNELKARCDDRKVGLD